jgi:N-acetylmuramoyl-L-alanine amidase
MNYLLALLLALFGFGDPPQVVAPEGGGGRVSIPLGEARSGPPLPAVTPARGDDPPLVVIDPGHGGRDPGAPSAIDGVEEKQVTLALAKAIRDELAASGRVRVALTREDDRLIPLADRYGIARRLGADLFISLHADAAPSNDAARGATIYTLSEVASDQEAAALAQRQNASDAIGGVAMAQDPNVNLILIDLAQRESMEISARFAQILHREASPLFPFQENWHRFAGFIVLKAPDIPSILFEAGYVSNAEDAAYLSSDEGRREIATGLRRAIEAHFSRRFLGRRSRVSR